MRRLQSTNSTSVLSVRRSLGAVSRSSCSIGPLAVCPSACASIRVARASITVQHERRLKHRCMDLCPLVDSHTEGSETRRSGSLRGWCRGECRDRGPEDCRVRSRRGVQRKRKGRERERERDGRPSRRTRRRRPPQLVPRRVGSLARSRLVAGF